MALEGFFFTSKCFFLGTLGVYFMFHLLISKHYVQNKTKRVPNKKPAQPRSGLFLQLSVLIASQCV